jgi:DNA invertase Pin-like site-specific DNA recombinase
MECNYKDVVKALKTHLFSALAEFKRNLIRERTQAGANPSARKFAR